MVDRTPPDDLARAIADLAREHGYTLERVVFRPRDLAILRRFDVRHEYAEHSLPMDVTDG